MEKAEKLLCPSIMCANYDCLKEEVRALDEAGTDIFHVDIMDGSFVPNFGMGPQDLQCVRKNTKKQIDVHLMIQNPGDYIELFANFGADIIYIHSEATQHPSRTLDKIHTAGKHAGVAINPGTSLETISELLPLVEYVLVMTVNPGFSGQKYIEHVTAKIRKLVDMRGKDEYHIMVDGALSPQKIKELSNIGVEGFILGTSALFGKSGSYAEVLPSLRMGCQII